MPLATGQIPYNTTLSLPPERLEQTRRLCEASFVKDNGQPFDYGETQLLIIAAIVGRIRSRIQLILPTQYGKSEAVAQGILIRAVTNPEKWAIVAPTKDKAEIIMGYIIKHIFDNEIYSEQLIFDEPIEKLKQHKAKDHLTFKGGGEIMILSADARNRQRTKEALMGFGSPNVVIDESALIDDDLYATIKRMVGGHAREEGGTFILEIGNPFTRGHFLRTWIGGRYARIWVDWQKALAEGRYTEDFIAEMRDEAFFDVLYECLFPEGDEVRADGYRRLLVDATIENAILTEEPAILKDAEGNEVPDKPILGVDVAAGGENQTVFVLRYPTRNYAKVLEKNYDEDLENQADRIQAYCRQYGVGDYRVSIDDGGVGHGLSSILHRRDVLFKQVLFGESPHKHANRLTDEMQRDKGRYANNRAMMYWRLRQWIKADGGKLIQDAGFGELAVINYKQNTSDKLQIEPKDKMAERGIKSPDTADALALTFINTGAIVEEDDIIDTSDDDDFDNDLDNDDDII